MLYYTIRIKGAKWVLFDGYCKNINDEQLQERKQLAQACLKNTSEHLDIKLFKAFPR